MGRHKGQPKTGGAVKGSVKTNTIAVKAAILRVFNEVNQDDEYLRDIAINDRHLFMSLVAKLFPTAVEVDVTNTINLGDAMREAEARLNSQLLTPHNIIDVTSKVEASNEEAEHAIE